MAELCRGETSLSGCRLCRRIRCLQSSPKPLSPDHNHPLRSGKGRPLDDGAHLYPVIFDPSAVRQQGKLGQRSTTMSGTLGNAPEMIRKGAPRLINSVEELKEYTDALFQ